MAVGIWPTFSFSMLFVMACAEWKGRSQLLERAGLLSHVDLFLMMMDERAGLRETKSLLERRCMD
jgi:hypothetical protein